MKPLTLRCRQPIARGLRLNLNGLVPQRLKKLTCDEISRLEIPGIHAPLKLGHFFDVIDGDRERLRFEGDLSCCDYVGGQLDCGELEVVGPVGHYAGFAMTGGSLKIYGDADQFACSGMRGGFARIEGNVGDFLAGVASATGKVMRGGNVVVTGSVGRWAAARMRRGTVVIHGQVAEGLAMRMTAGTVICCGHPSIPFGCGMRRGTLMFLGGSPPPREIVGFSCPEPVELAFLPVFLNHLREYLPETTMNLLPEPVSRLPRRAHRSLGDRSVNGLGELMWLEL
jgi:formylmethanofuran dehydrogenase subunit C